MLVRELKEFLADKDDLSDVIIDTFEIKQEKQSMLPIKEIYEYKYEGMAIAHNDIVIVL